jgi:hypothetical protein
MIRVPSPEQLVNAFREIDRDLVQIPAELEFPLAVKDYIAWMEPSGVRTYLVYNDRDSRLLGVSFKRIAEPADAPVKMCQWCHSVRGGGRVSMLSVAISQNRRVGLHLCRDLSCKEKLVAPPKNSDVPELLKPEEKLTRLMERMSEFIKNNLF